MDDIFIILWIGYVASVAFAIYFSWRLTKHSAATSMIGYLRILLVVLLILPIQLPEMPGSYAPAFTVAIFEYAQGRADGAFDSLLLLSVAFVTVSMIFILVKTTRWLKARPKSH